jgi:hypothetical protein
MREDLGRIGWTGAWIAIALCALVACSAAPGSTDARATVGASGTSVVDEVRLTTDRSAARQEVVTLPNGERMRRVSLRNGFSHVLVGKIGPDGKPSVSCVDSAPAAEAFLAGDKQGTAQ